MGKLASFSPSELARLAAADYARGDSSTTIAARYGVANATALRYARRGGAEVRTGLKFRRLYEVDEGYFDRVDTEAKAYWLGFLAADGCVTDGNRISVGLGRVDRGHLEKLKAALRAGHPVKDWNYVYDGAIASTDGDSRFNVRSDRLAAALAKHGVRPRKTAACAPARLRADLSRHYWRGAFDGDGGVWSEMFKGSRKWCVGFCGTRAMVEGFARFARAHCDTSAGVREKPGMWRFELANHKAANVLRALYEGASVSLDRNRTLVAEAIAWADAAPRSEHHRRA